MNELKDIYVLYIRSVLEYYYVLWHSILTVGQSQAIERVQKLCLKKILKNEYNTYTNALKSTVFSWD